MRKGESSYKITNILLFYYYNTYFFNFAYPLRCLRVPPGVRVPQVEYHCYNGRVQTCQVRRRTFP
jgi:hypothetical protein